MDSIFPCRSNISSSFFCGSQGNFFRFMHLTSQLSQLIGLFLSYSGVRFREHSFLFSPCFIPCFTPIFLTRGYTIYAFLFLFTKLEKLPSLNLPSVGTVFKGPADHHVFAVHAGKPSQPSPFRMEPWPAWLSGAMKLYVVHIYTFLQGFLI